MPIRVAASWIAGAAIVVMTVSLGAQARLGGSITANPPTGPVPRLADGKPDLSGVWLRRDAIGDVGTVLPKGETMPLLPEARKIMQAHQAKDDPQANCLPLATPRSAPYPFRIVTAPTHVFILYEVMHSYRQVFMDGRTHPEGLEYICNENNQDVPHIQGPAIRQAQ